MTLSFDDGHTHDRKLIACFNAWRLKATFNLNSGNLGRKGRPTPAGSRAIVDQCEVAELYRGHEIAVHTATHPYLTKLTDAQIAAEVSNDREALEQIIQRPVRGMAYPFGDFDQRVVEVVRSLGVVYARTCVVAEPCFPTEEPLAWATSGHQYAKAPSVLERFESRYNDIGYIGSFAIWGHGFEFDDRNDWEGVARIFKPLSGKLDVWYCTNIELFDYEAARKGLIIDERLGVIKNPANIPVWVSIDGERLEIEPRQTISTANKASLRKGIS